MLCQSSWCTARFARCWRIASPLRRRTIHAWTTASLEIPGSRERGTFLSDDFAAVVEVSLALLHFLVPLAGPTDTVGVHFATGP